MGWVYWLLATGVCIALEAGHPGLFLFLSFAGGAGVAAVVAALNYSIIQQFLSACIGSGITFVILSLWLRHEGQLGVRHGYRSNVYRLIGKKGIVTEAIPSGKFGFVKLDGDIWRARAVHGQSIPNDTVVMVRQVVGAHIVVEKIV